MRCACLVLLMLAAWAAHSWTLDQCPPPPLCDDPAASMMTKMWCHAGRDPMRRESQEYRDMVVHRLTYFLNRNLLGQDHLHEPILRDVRSKLLRPREPLVMHFAGDNGVGKTSTAHWISAAMSFRCHPMNAGSYCAIGDQLLSLSGTNYHGVPVESFRQQVVGRIVAHAKRYPYGVVVLNDLTELDRDHVAVLLPLLGRSEHFSEDTTVDLRLLTVIITTDFGRQGRTRGKDLQQVRLMVEEDVRVTFGALAGSMLRTYAFIPATLAAANSIVRLSLYDWACAERLGSFEVSENVVKEIVDGCVDRVAHENGRAVMLHMEGLMGSLRIPVGQSLEHHNVSIRQRAGGLEVAMVDDIHSPSENDEL